MPTIYHIKQKKLKHSLRSCGKQTYDAGQAGQLWIVDINRDILWDGRTIETVLIKDGYTNRVIQIGTETWQPDLGILILFEHLKKSKRLPELIFIKTGIKRFSIHVDIWCRKHKVKLGFAQSSAVSKGLSRQPERSKSLENIHLPASFKTVREALSFSKTQATTPEQHWFRKKQKR